MAMAMVFGAVGQAMTDAGISKAIVHFRDLSHRQLSSLFWLNLAAGLIVYLAFHASAGLMAAIYSEARLEPVLRIMALMFLLAPWGQVFFSSFEKALRFNTLAKIEVTAAVLGFITSVISAYLDAGVYALVFGNLANVGSKSLMLVLTGWKDWHPSFHLAFTEIAPLLRFGIYQLGERMLNISQQHLDKLILGITLGASQLGSYSVVAQLAQRPIMMINPILTRVAFPVFSKVQSDNAKLRKGYQELISTVALIQMPIYMGMLATADRLIPILLGEEWSQSVLAFQLLCLLGILRSLGNPIGSLLLAKGRTDWGFHMNLAAVVIYGAAAWIGSSFGVEGVVLALVAASLGFFFPLGFVIRWKLIGMGIMEFFSAFMPFLAAAIAMALTVYLVASLAGIETPALDLAGKVAVGVTSYLAILSILKIRQYHYAVDTVRQLLNRLS